jgi:glucuronate isomerase
MSDIFITENFLLQNDSAVALYHEYAKDLPIIDYHCHLPSEQVATDHRFENLAQIWLYGDHYKWRAMRAAGIEEAYCTGDASDWEKFEKWAEVVPQTLRNPLYHWTHLELKRPFGISNRLLNPETAQGIWDECNEKLSQDDFSCRGIMRQMKVRLVCTTDDPTDSLEHHRAIRDDESFDIQVLPTFRPDKAMAVDNTETFNAWVDKLSEVTGLPLNNFDQYLEAIRARHDYFHELGCRLSDHGMEYMTWKDYKPSQISTIFRRLRRGNELTSKEKDRFRSAMLVEFAKMDYEKSWTQQFHIGIIRDNSSRKLEELGPDTGFDSISDPQVAAPMSKFFDQLDQEDQLAKTILYNANPVHNEVFATMAGNYQDSRVPGKMQFGSGWWFLDQKNGMEQQMTVLSNLGLLSRFVGMLTDSRSFLSYTRHEYFRRILCNLLGTEMEQGILPRDMEMIGNLVQKISYHNAASFFGFDL